MCLNRLVSSRERLQSGKPITLSELRFPLALRLAGKPADRSDVTYISIKLVRILQAKELNLSHARQCPLGLMLT